MSRPPELWGLTEVARAAGASPQAVCNWRVRYPDFPEPAAELRMGPVWFAREVRPWLRRTGRLGR